MCIVASTTSSLVLVDSFIRYIARQRRRTYVHCVVLLVGVDFSLLRYFSFSFIFHFTHTVFRVLTNIYVYNT